MTMEYHELSDIHATLETVTNLILNNLDHQSVEVQQLIINLKQGMMWLREIYQDMPNQRQNLNQAEHVKLLEQKHQRNLTKNDYA